MIGIPERAAINGLQPPLLQQSCATGSAAFLQSEIFGNCIRLTNRTHASITRKGLVAQETGIRAQAPLVDAEIGAERQPSFGDFQLTPSAEIPALGSLREILASGKAALECTRFQPDSLLRPLAFVSRCALGGNGLPGHGEAPLERG